MGSCYAQGLRSQSAGVISAKAGLPVDAVTHHLVFAGPPGTGKTTVALLYGELLAALGALAQGQVVQVGAADLIAKYVGHTAQQTRNKFEEARGGVLVIDEAYALARPAGIGHDFGLEAIDTLIKLMEDHRDEVVVIVAGYGPEMDAFLARNPGLASRFSRMVTFEPYDIEELLEIFVTQATQAGYEVPAETRQSVRRLIEAEHDRFEQGNAREIRKLLITAITARARHTRQSSSQGNEPTTRLLSTLFPEDIDS